MSCLSEITASNKNLPLEKRKILEAQKNGLVTAIITLVALTITFSIAVGLSWEGLKTYQMTLLVVLFGSILITHTISIHIFSRTSKETRKNLKESV